MQFKEIAKGVKIPVLGLRTWKMGGEARPDRSKDEECIATLRHGIKLGMTHIDTAEMYGDGHAEEIVAQAIKEFDREKLFITSKVMPQNFRYNDLINSAKKSLKRMKIDQMDLYLLHWPSHSIPLSETMRAMEYLLEQELTRFIGVSNFSVELMEDAQSHLDKKNRIVTNQVEYSLIERDPEIDILPFCQKNKIIVTAYSPLAQGKLLDHQTDVINGMVKKYKKTYAQIALNWLISQPQVIAIPKASKIEHIEENAGAIGWKLEIDDIGKLNPLHLI